MVVLFLLLAFLLAVIAFQSNHKADKIENGSEDFHNQPNTACSSQHESSHDINGKDIIGSPVSNDQDNDSSIEEVERYVTWQDYLSKHPSRAKGIKSLGIDLSSKTDEDASEWIFSIETTAKDYNCKISELKKKYFERLEKKNPTDAEWIFNIKDLVDLSKDESQKYNLKIGNTAADMMLLFILEKIKSLFKNKCEWKMSISRMLRHLSFVNCLNK